MTMVSPTFPIMDASLALQPRLGQEHRIEAESAGRRSPPGGAEDFGSAVPSPTAMALQGLDETAVEAGGPRAAALVARHDDVEIASAGELAPDSIVRLASITKPITAAAVLLLVDEGLVALDDPVARWLPELESPRVVRTPASPI